MSQAKEYLETHREAIDAIVGRARLFEPACGHTAQCARHSWSSAQAPKSLFMTCVALWERVAAATAAVWLARKVHLIAAPFQRTWLQLERAA
jgi:hypothetical protein